MPFKSFHRMNHTDPKNLFLLHAQISDYARAGLGLLAQRVLIYGAALLLEGFYYSWKLALLSLSVLIVSELFDLHTFKKILRLEAGDIAATRACLKLLKWGTVLSALNIAGFAVSIAILQGHTTHFMPLFFLLAAALFATLNNSQITSILYLRLSIYLIAFLFIPIYDIIMVRASLDSELWVQFFTCVFVMFFIADCSRVTSQLYKKTLLQMEALRQEHQKTKAAYIAKSNFLSTVSHELRTPLTSIKGSIDLIAFGAFGKLPEKMEKAILIAQRNSVSLHTLINDLLDLQKMESGKMDFHFETVHLASFLEHAVATNEPFVTKMNSRIYLEHVEDNLYVNADPSRLGQVLSNILSNAAKFSEAGETVRVRAKCNGSTVRISIQDSGFGLKESDRQKVFDEFSQLDSSDQRKVGGTGLGMNISKRIVEAHQGTLDYYKNKDKGTTFYIDLALVTQHNSSSSPAYFTDMPPLKLRA
ncbi:sensor histidine kinase [Roseovarius sp. S4756]|uniref:sensor histidine kinase n=1 Tax=Roseovarius maritimus TaxID=3342637 RepID=UPI00372786D0